MLPCKGQPALEVVGNVDLGFDEQIARQPDNAFIRATTGRGRQFGRCGRCDVDPDHREVTIFEFPNIRAPATGNGAGTVLVGVWTDSAEEFYRCSHTLP